MKLYELKKGQRFKVNEAPRIPPDAKTVVKTQILTFDHTDGLYSFCFDEAGHVVHPAAWTEVTVVEP